MVVPGHGQPFTGQGQPERQELGGADILPPEPAVALLRRLEARLLPSLDEPLDVVRIHRAIAKQVIVMPDAAADQVLVILLAPIPAAGAFLADQGDWNDEVDEFEAMAIAHASRAALQDVPAAPGRPCERRTQCMQGAAAHPGERAGGKLASLAAGGCPS